MEMCLPPSRHLSLRCGHSRGSCGTLRSRSSRPSYTFRFLILPCRGWGDQVVGLLQKMDAPALDELVIAVPKISLDRVPQRSVCRRSKRAEQLVEVPTIVSYSSLQQRTAGQIDHRHTSSSWSRRSRRRWGVFKVHAQDRVQQRVLWSRPLTFQLLMVVVDLAVMEAFKVSPRDRVQQRSVEQISLTSQSLMVVV